MVWFYSLVLQFLLVFFLIRKDFKNGLNGFHFPLWGSFQIVPLIMSIIVLHIYISPDMGE